MFVRSAYYSVKPFLPTRVRLALRRWHVRNLLPTVGERWPINEDAGQPPAGWPGWPDGKQFAFVLSHDVEGTQGLAKTRELAGLEMAAGFRSSFNFIPEGDYRVSSDLRQWLAANRFEVGVHDLVHDGKLYDSRSGFRARAARINQYLRNWQARGFRSGFMLRNLGWLHDLEIQYDASTFDTDPFEPQPQGAATIFPFWVPAPSNTQFANSPLSAGGEGRGEVATGTINPPTSILHPPSVASRTGYVELPYTLPQDSTVFLLLGEKNINLWKRKLDWIAGRGGMALLDTHPDYMCFNGGQPTRSTFDVCLYCEMLDYVKARYHGRYWHALPHEVASYARGLQHTAPQAFDSMAAVGRRMTGKKIWIDLDNTPHVPFFLPIIRQLKMRGHSVAVTARDAFQVCELADLKGLPYQKVGRHHGKNRLAKASGLLYRALQLLPFALREKPDLALSHGARSQIIISNSLRIPTVLVADYEHAQTVPLGRPQWEIIPEAIPVEAAHANRDRILKYPGLKEDVYASTLHPDAALLPELGIDNGAIVVVVRPPATEAHYHNPESEVLFELAMSRLSSASGVRVILLPRNKRQAEWVKSRWPEWFEHQKTIIPQNAVDGLNLLWYSDLVISGGGTMNREAAALGVPVYSIFRGTIGAIDRELSATGRLILLTSPQDVETRLRIERRANRGSSILPPVAPALDSIVRHVETILGHYP